MQKSTISRMNCLRLLVTFLSGLLLSAGLCPTVSAAAVRTVSGLVTDAETGAPIDFASVFFSGTTRGMVTMEDGAFEIKLPGYGTYELVASHLEYATAHITLQTGSLTDSVFHFVLTPKAYDLDEVVVREKRHVGISFQNLFWQRFFGVSTLKDKVIEAVNPDVVQYNFNVDTKTLKARADEPIIVDNHFLGYRIYYTLSEFSYNCRTLVTILRGYPRFEPLAPASDEEAAIWRVNRQQAYHGSLMQFTRTLYNGTASEAGFIAQAIVRQEDETSSDDWREQKRIRDAEIMLTQPVPWKQLVVSSNAAPARARTLNSDRSLFVSELTVTKEGKRRERTDTTELFSLHFKNNRIYFYPDGSFYPPADMVKESRQKTGILYLLPWDYVDE